MSAPQASLRPLARSIASSRQSARARLAVVQMLRSPTLAATPRQVQSGRVSAPLLLARHFAARREEAAEDQRKRSRSGTAKPQPQNPCNTRRIGLRLPVFGPFEAGRGVVGGYPIQALNGAFNYTSARKRRFGTALRRPVRDPRALFVILPKQFKLGSILNCRDTGGQHLRRLSGAEQLLVYPACPFPIPCKNMI